ncbi:HEAT repeat domain-containing protein [Leptolyngbya sp. AN02str]|uniref:HEAT repeat domain-containing protein n=1 Tax=Leptolyngbya sp. AN02str TaxID=3423363 RepID=UPI003D31F05F
MAKSRKLDELTAALAEVRHDPFSNAATNTVRRVLQSPYGTAIAQATRFIAQYELTDFIPELVSTFERCMLNGAKTDPNCLAKEGVVDALYRLNYGLHIGDESVFLQGIHHVQMEPVWGGQMDTAAKLRGICAMGLVRMNYPDVLTELADLLADAESPARIAAARAIAYSGHPSGVALLRLRSRIGDEPTVISECLTALLTLDPQGSLSFVASFLQHPEPQTQELTALVLGESRLPQALGLLQHWWSHTTEPELRQTALLAIATLRYPDAIQFLLGLLSDSPPTQANEALAALKIYEHDPVLWQEVSNRVSPRTDLPPSPA